MNKKFIITDIKRIVYVGATEYPQKVINFSHNETANELIFHFSGKSTVYFNGVKLRVKEDTIRFLPQGNVNQYEVHKEEYGDCIDICFNTDLPVSDEAFVINMKGNKKIAALFKKAFSVWVAKNDGYYFECISIIYKIFSEIQKSSYKPEKKFEKIKPAIEYITENLLNEQISCEHLADICGISYSYLKRLFIEKYDMSPKKYIIKLKIDYACDLLSSERYSVGEIAQMAGFSDIYFFSRQFKNQIGISPTQFANKYISSK